MSKYVKIEDCFMCPHCAIGAKDDEQICGVTKNDIPDNANIPNECPLPDIIEPKRQIVKEIVRHANVMPNGQVNGIYVDGRDASKSRHPDATTVPLRGHFVKEF